MQDWFPLSSIAPEGRGISAVSVIANTSAYMQTGTYGDGLISILSLDDGAMMLTPWTEGIGEVICIVITGVGDAFYWSKKNKAVYFLDAQLGTYSFVDKDVNWFLYEFLVKQGVKTSVLKEKKFTELLGQYGPVNYGETFFPVPYLAAGGSGSLNTYQRGDSAVYFSMLAQTIGMTNVVTTD